MIDLHAHLLPCVDDGAASVAEAVELARIAVQDGIREMVLTPHIHAGRWEHTRATLAPRFDAFKRVLRHHGIPLRLHLGAEVRIGPDILAALAFDALPTIGRWEDARVLVLELPPGHIPPGAINIARPLREQGVVPLIAHPERNREIIANIRRLIPFVRAGCLVQLTAASIAGRFGAAQRDTAHAILEAGWATAIASDAHSLELRPPVLSEARALIERRYGKPAARTLFVVNPRRIVDGAHGGTPRGVLDQDDVASLMDAATQPRERALVALAYGAGLRPTELVSLRAADLDLERRVLHVSGDPRNARDCPLPPFAVAAIRSLGRPAGPWLFPSRSRPAEPITEATAQKIFHQLLERAGITEPLSLRDLRKAYARHQFEAGVALPAIQRLLGHRAPAATLGYLNAA